MSSYIQHSMVMIMIFCIIVYLNLMEIRSTYNAPINSIICISPFFITVLMNKITAIACNNSI